MRNLLGRLAEQPWSAVVSKLAPNSTLDVEDFVRLRLVLATVLLPPVNKEIVVFALENTLVLN